MIGNMQKGLVYDGYGIILLDLETFTKVMHLLYSHSMKLYYDERWTNFPV